MEVNMKQHAHSRSFIWGLVILFLFLINCEHRGDKSANNIAEQLVEYLKEQMPKGFKFETKLGNSLVKPTENNRYLVTLKNSVFTADTAAILKYFLRSFDLFLRDDLPVELDIITIEEMLFLYDPKEKYVGLESLKGLCVDRDLSKLVKKTNNDNKLAEVLKWLQINWSTKRIRFYLGTMNFENWDISKLLKSIKEDSSKNVEISKKKNPQPFKITVEDIQFNIDFVENISLLIDIERIKNSSTELKEEKFFNYIWEKNAPLPNIENILQKGLPISGSSVELEKINISIKKNGNQWINGIIDSFSYSSVLKPDENRKNLELSFAFGIKKLNLPIPYKKRMELFINLKEGGVTFSINNIHPGVLLALLEFAKKSFQLKDSADEPKIREHMLNQGLKFISEYMQSNPLKFSYGIGIKNLELSIPGKKELELLSNIKECRITSSYENINAKTLQPMMEYAKKSVQWMNLPGDQKLQEFLKKEGKSLREEMMKSGVVIKSSLSPLKHYFGEISIEQVFRPWPLEIKTSIKIKKIDEIFKKLEESGLVSPFTLMFVRQGLQQIAIRDENGNASIVMEMRADQPGIIFLNGFSVRIPENMLKSPMQGFGF
jgi:hypothetical protein